MSFCPNAPVGAASYRLVVDAEPDANALLRLLEPFVIHDVLPERVDVSHERRGPLAGLSVELQFCASADLAARLAARLEAMVSVRDVALCRDDRRETVAA